MNKMRIGKDGKRSEMRRTGRRWRKPMAQMERKCGFVKFGEDGVSSFASRMTQGIFVGHHDRTRAVSCITKNGVVRGKSWTRQTVSDGLGISELGRPMCDTPWQMVAPELKLTKEVAADKEGAGPPLPRIVVERAPEVEPRRFYVLSARRSECISVFRCNLLWNILRVAKHEIGQDRTRAEVGSC